MPRMVRPRLRSYEMQNGHTWGTRGELKVENGKLKVKGGFPLSDIRFQMSPLALTVCTVFHRL